VASIINDTSRFAVLLAALLAAGAAAAADGATTAMAANNCAPAGDLRGNAERGRSLHLAHCADCHGADGKALVIVMHMDVPPKDQSDPGYMKTLPDAFLYLAICKGGEAVGRNHVMPGWGGIMSDQDIRDLVAWVRTFSGT
jgi:mono/diheme cytochrome c family protein